MDLFDVFNLDSGQKRKLDEIEEPGVENIDNIDDNIVDQLLQDVKKVKNETTLNNLVENLSSIKETENLEEFEHFTPRVVIHELETKSSCLHEVVIPTDLEYIPLRDESESENYKPAKEYKFVLDPFQKEAILCIENHQSVLGIYCCLFVVYVLNCHLSFGSYFCWKDCCR